ncbi:insulinase family protein [Flavobacteriaceae bacterium R38]|nr:insulinase family protein [Flavobacteriaceae bacterium R38]
MKKIIASILLLCSIVVNAQIDRSKQPQPGPAPEINLGEPKVFDLANGLKVLVVENHKLPRVSYSLRLDNPPVIEGDKAGVSQLTGSLLGKGSTNIDKDSFNDEVDFLGAFINIGSNGGFASGLSKYSERILELFADAALNPNFSEEELEKERNIILDNLKSNEKSVANTARRVESVLAYGKDHPNGEFITKETVNNVNLNDVKDYYRNYFVPGKAYLVVIGDIAFKDVKKQVKKYFSSWVKASPPSLTYSEPSNAQYTQINFIDTPNAVQSEIAVQNTINLKIKDPDYFPALIANEILGGGGEGRLFLNLREDKGYTYGAYSGIGTNKYTSSTFRASASVRNAVTDSAVVAFLDEINRIITEPVSQEDLSNTKAKYVGRFVRALERPQTIANYALNIETQDLPKDFYQTYLEKINNVTVNEVLEASKKYFTLANAKIVVTGKGSEVLENLNKVSFNGKKIPVQYFDKYGASTEKPNYDKPLPEGLTAATVFDKYFDAIGGKTAAEAIKSVYMIAEASVNGASLGIELKRTAQNQSADVISFGGNVVQKTAFNRENGYTMAQGQKIDFSDEQIKNAKIDALPFPELAISNAKIERIEAVDGKEAYVVQLREGKVAYYDIASGLKVKEVDVQKAPTGQEVTVTTTYSDYKEVNGIKFPFKITRSLGPQSLELKINEIKVNEGISDQDFN